MRERIRDGIDSAKEKFEDVEDSSVRYIKKNPLKSVAIAAGVGVLIGAALYMGIEAAVRAKTRRQSFWDRHNPFN
jgi:hypothetical protein